MGKRTIVPFGPQHPVLPEPIHIDLVMEDETVVEAIPSVGFIHRGLESLIEKKDYNEMVYVAERICGICSFMHGMGYCEAVEHVMDVEVPDRAKYLRTIWCEFSRLHSHLLWLGLLADGFGFEALFNECWRIRERVLDMVEMTTGGRLIASVNKPGGVLKDITPDMLKVLEDNVKIIERDIKKVSKTFLNDYTVKSRLCGSGILTKEDAIKLGACGPMMRASGIEVDLRKNGYAAYDDIDFEVITSNDCDGYGRCAVRIGELLQSCDIVKQAIAKIPEGDILVKPQGNPDGEFLMRLEQPRGEAFYYVKGNGTKFLERFRVRTPTFANLAPLVATLKGAAFADVPLLVLTIDPCISCTER
ncbi:MAG: nickel-dependent hydrogenase large subunit [Lachnospiraceae bacterium]|nr:nickel-dependent hydrogenase large subunit [Lachnospiraceae bacterium]